MVRKLHLKENAVITDLGKLGSSLNTDSIKLVADYLEKQKHIDPRYCTLHRMDNPSFHQLVNSDSPIIVVEDSLILSKRILLGIYDDDGEYMCVTRDKIKEGSDEQREIAYRLGDEFYKVVPNDLELYANDYNKLCKDFSEFKNRFNNIDITKLDSYGTSELRNISSAFRNISSAFADLDVALRNLGV